MCTYLHKSVKSVNKNLLNLYTVTDRACKTIKDNLPLIEQMFKMMNFFSLASHKCTCAVRTILIKKHAQMLI